MGYDEALQELYQAPTSQFVAERKRLADELKKDGDAADAKRLLERKKPTMSAWVVNQLYWHARDAFDEMLATAEQLRNGHLKATGAHREAIAKLRKRAASILEDAGHAATEATLRRVTQTLAALSATGGFDPDPPGALAEDRDPPGFEAVGIVSPRVDEDEEPAPKHKAHAKHDEDAETRRRAEMAEKKRLEEERKRKAAERHQLETALRSAKNDLEAAQRIVKHLDKQLAKANEDVANAQSAVDDISEKLAALDAN